MTQAPSITVSYDEEKGMALIKPTHHLGSYFNAYRTRMKVSGLTYNKKANGYYVPKEQLKGLLKSFKGLEWDVTLARSVLREVQRFNKEQLGLVNDCERRVAETNRTLSFNNGSLYPYQEEAIRGLCKMRGCLLAEPMGLGKTVMALLSVPEGSKVIVVCPSVAKAVWEREANFWRPFDRTTTIDKRHKVWKFTDDLTILSQDSIPEKCDLMPNRTYTVIFDEAHSFKNSKAQRTKKARALSSAILSKGGFSWALTGTPVLNRPLELWNILALNRLQYKVFGHWDEFVSGFNGYKNQWGGYVFGAPEPWIKERLKQVMIRHDKREVLPDLPRKRRQRIPVSLPKALNKQLDRVVSEHGTEWIENINKNQKLVIDVISKLRKDIATAKIATMLEIVEEYEEEEEPLIVASSHRAPILELAGREGWAVITGDTSAKERGRIQDRFQAGHLKGVGLTIKAGGVAITLTNASHMLFVDLDWTPGMNEQCEDRINRIGQTKPCLYKILEADHELESLINQRLLEKKELISEVIG